MLTYSETKTIHDSVLDWTLECVYFGV